MGRHYPRDLSPLEVTEWLLRQPPRYSRGLIVNRPFLALSFHGRLFQAAMWRDHAMTIKYDRGSQRGTGVGKWWLLDIGGHTYPDCVRRARVNLYLARRLRR